MFAAWEVGEGVFEAVAISLMALAVLCCEAEALTFDVLFGDCDNDFGTAVLGVASSLVLAKVLVMEGR